MKSRHSEYDIPNGRSNRAHIDEENHWSEGPQLILLGLSAHLRWRFRALILGRQGARERLATMVPRTVPSGSAVRSPPHAIKVANIDDESGCQKLGSVADVLHYPTFSNRDRSFGLPRLSRIAVASRRLVALP